MSEQSSRVIAWEVWKQMVELRERGDVRRDSARLSSAIRTIAERRGVRFQEVESALDGALAFRRA